MKIFFITLLLLVSSISLITILDLIMGSNLYETIPNLRKPFEVSDPAEYFLSFILLAYLIIKPILVFLVKKKTKSSSGK